MVSAAPLFGVLGQEPIFLDELDRPEFEVADLVGLVAVSVTHLSVGGASRSPTTPKAGAPFSCSPGLDVPYRR
jgi:hypothetical protein